VAIHAMAWFPLCNPYQAAVHLTKVALIINTPKFMVARAIYRRSIIENGNSGDLNLVGLQRIKDAEAS
jgi:hypothetical protein